MDCFHFEALQRPGPGDRPPPGYGVGRVRIGDLEETIFFSTEIWSPSDYARHWRATAQLLLEGQTGLFCTDLTEENACIFIGFPVGQAFDFEEWVVPRHNFELDRLQLKMAPSVRCAKASCWRVSAEAVRLFASR